MKIKAKVIGVLNHNTIKIDRKLTKGRREK